MSGSETGLITSREPVPFTTCLQNNPVTSQPVIQNMRLAFGADVSPMYKAVNPAPNATAGDGESTVNPVGESTVNPGLNLNMGGGEPMKRKRGRPRKYGTDGQMGLALISGGAQPFMAAQMSGGGSGLSSPQPPTSGGSASLAFKKARGRPPGSGRKQQLVALGSTGLGFTPHVITVKAGEDISSKITAFSQHGPRAVCVLSASGAISNVTLCQPATSGGTVTYEGRFEILSLSGSFLVTASGGQHSRTGGLSVSLSGPDGHVFGGGVAGLLTAASPVQVVVGSFIVDGRKERKFKRSQMEPLSAPPKFLPTPIQTQTGPGSPQSHGGTHSESSGGLGSPLNQQSTGACNNPSMSTIQWK